MSPEQFETIRHFQASEFARHLDMDAEFMVFLDGVREQYGHPLMVTSDARTLEEEEALPGHADPASSSLHVAEPALGRWARAVDLSWITDGMQRWAFVAAVLRIANGRGVELELVPFGGNRHVHLGLFRDDRSSVLIFSEV